MGTAWSGWRGKRTEDSAGSVGSVGSAGDRWDGGRVNDYNNTDSIVVLMIELMDVLVYI